MWDEVIRRFEASDVPMLRDAADLALCGRARHELAEGRASTAVGPLDRALMQGRAGMPPSRLQAHLIRAGAHLATGDRDGCEGDVGTALSILPELNGLDRIVLATLAGLALDIGPGRIREPIKSSPADDLLLPLTAALEPELGLEPRVAREVEEIAEDMRRE